MTLLNCAHSVHQNSRLNHWTELQKQGNYLQSKR